MANLKPYQMDSWAFIQSVLADTDFRNNGYLVGLHNPKLYYVVIDPARHPFFVWRKRGEQDYQASGQLLNSVVFTNGPQMNDPEKSPIQTTLEAAGVGVAGGLGVGYGVKALLGAFGLKASVATGIGVIVGLLVGVSLGAAYLNGWFERLIGWIPFGRVIGQKNGINDPGKNFVNWAWFGRSGAADIDAYEMKQKGDPPALPEVSGGLSPLLFNYAVLSAVPAAPNHSEEYEGIYRSKAVVAWALVPLAVKPAGSSTAIPPNPEAPEAGFTAAQLNQMNVVRADGTTLKGLIVVAGSDDGWNKTISSQLLRIGARDAIATDGGQSILLGTGGEVLVRGADNAWMWKTRERLQKYGFACS